ncbi:MAG TPA: hypothetical protein VFX49_13465 [Chloroflexota bacterium]|nr:hypothetical protein [Chloroflexota bacterium]
MVVRRDALALWAGVLFSFAFTGLIWLAGERLEAIPKLPDEGASWYYWKLPEPTLWSRATAWGGYAAHQLALWGLIVYAQRRVRRYTTGLHRVNLVALAVNAGFAVLHFVQTHVWYDGLAQDVSIFSSQGSVVLLLVWVLLMENDRRGLFFGRRAPFARELVRFARRYHGYVFAWAAVYTFWYHPMENTSGHLIGFVYMFFLLLQGSLFFTRAHLNRWWTFTLEAIVLVHGTLVAVMQGNGLWPMFALGFAGLIVVTQMHGLGLGRGPKWLAVAAYAAATALIYNWRGWARIDEVVRIPVIEYASVFVLAGLLWVGLRIASVTRVRARAAGAAT